MFVPSWLRTSRKIKCFCYYELTSLVSPYPPISSVHPVICHHNDSAMPTLLLDQMFSLLFDNRKDILGVTVKHVALYGRIFYNLMFPVYENALWIWGLAYDV